MQKLAGEAINQDFSKHHNQGEVKNHKATCKAKLVYLHICMSLVILILAEENPQGYPENTYNTDSPN